MGKELNGLIRMIVVLIIILYKYEYSCSIKCDYNKSGNRTFYSILSLFNGFSIDVDVNG
jgi:hypothetical protein